MISLIAARCAGDSRDRWNGAQLAAGLSMAAAWLRVHTERLNGLNVYPVPDGDTGTNLSLTLDAAAEITGYSREELEPAFDQLVRGRVWSVNDGLPRRMVEFNVDTQVRVGNIPPDKKPTYEQLVDRGPVEAALKALGRWTDDPGYL